MTILVISTCGGFITFWILMYTILIRCNHNYQKIHTTEYKDCYHILFVCSKCGKTHKEKV